MKQEKVIFAPHHQMSIDMCQIINRLAGRCFNNQSIVVEMGAVYRPSQPQDFILLSLRHLGIEAQLYVPLGEVERLLGLDIKHLAHDYITYVIAQVLRRYGIEFNSFLGFDEQGPPQSMTCQLILGEINVAALLQLDSLIIESEFLQARITSLPKNLSLTTFSTLFVTSLSVDEIRDLSVDDLVLVYEK